MTASTPPRQRRREAGGDRAARRLLAPNADDVPDPSLGPRGDGPQPLRRLHDPHRGTPLSGILDPPRTLRANRADTLTNSYRHLLAPGKLVVCGFARMPPRGGARPKSLSLLWGFWRRPDSIRSG